MKKQSQINFAKMSNEQTNKLTTVVKETLGLAVNPVKTLTTADLWNIQRKSNTMMHRRYAA